MKIFMLCEQNTYEPLLCFKEYPSERHYDVIAREVFGFYGKRDDSKIELLLSAKKLDYDNSFFYIEEVQVIE